MNFLWCTLENDPTQPATPRGSNAASLGDMATAAAESNIPKHRAATVWTAEQLLLFAQRGHVGAEVFRGDIYAVLNIESNDRSEVRALTYEQLSKEETPSNTTPIPNLIYAFRGLVANGRNAQLDELRGLLNLHETLQRTNHADEGSILYDAGFVHQFSAAIALAFAMANRKDLLEMLWRAHNSHMRAKRAYILQCCYARKCTEAINWFMQHFEAEAHACASIATNANGSTELLELSVKKYSSARATAICCGFPHARKYALDHLRKFSFTDICCFVQGLGMASRSEASPTGCNDGGDLVQRHLATFMNLLKDIPALECKQWRTLTLVAIQNHVDEIAAYCIKEMSAAYAAQKKNSQSTLILLFRTAVQYAADCRILKQIALLFKLRCMQLYEQERSKAHTFAVQMGYSHNSEYLYTFQNARATYQLVCGRHTSWTQAQRSRYQEMAAALASQLTVQALDKPLLLEVS